MANFLSKFFSGISKKQSSSVLGLDISSSSIKLVQLSRKKGRALLETYGELSLGPYASADAGQATNLSPTQIGQALKDLMREAKVSSNNAGIAMPLSASLISIMELPDVSEKELKEMIPLEVRKYIPVPISEVLLDWWIIPKDIMLEPEVEQKVSEGISSVPKKVEVLFVAIHKETISKYEEIAASAGLKVGFFEIEIFSTIRSVLEQGLAPAMVLDIGSSISKVYIVDRRVIRESHTINQGSQNISLAMSRALGVSFAEAEKAKRANGLNNANNTAEPVSLVLDTIFAEANKILLHYQKRYNKSVSKVVLTGGGSLLLGVLGVAQTAFKCNVELADAFAKVDYPPFLKDVLMKAGPEFAVSIGAAMRMLEENA